MNKIKLMIIIGTRPEIIKLSQIIKVSDLYFDLVLVHTGQNYDHSLNEVFFKEFTRNGLMVLEYSEPLEDSEFYAI